MQSAQLMIDWSNFHEEWSNYGPWILTHKGDQSVRMLADRHYSRQKVGSKQFCRPSSNLVLRSMMLRLAGSHGLEFVITGGGTG